MTLKRWSFAGLFLVTLATLMYEILLTRIFSVTMWYHFAFMAISMALFGMTVGAIVVYLKPRFFTVERARGQLARSALGFALSVPLSFLTYSSIPFLGEEVLRGQLSLVAVYSMVLTYVVLAIPFVLSGICVCLALTKFPGQVSALYAADLAGAAVGCVLLVLALRITDGPTAVFLVGGLACGGAVLFAWEAGSRRLRWGAVALGLLMALFVTYNTVQVQQQASLIRLLWVKGELQTEPPLYEKWNSFSRLQVKGDPDRLQAPFGWGLSPTCQSEPKVRQLLLDIDAAAGSMMVDFRGDLDNAAFLRCDITNLAHYLRPDARVLIIGPGGGRDILAALVFGQRSILGVEVNEDIVRLTNETFGDFTGHLDRDPRVRTVVDEARSYITRSDERFDIIQASLIDTWAATAAGAFVLTENSLYTVEAWQIFLEHLTSDGVLTFSRWYQPTPWEMYRLTALASTALRQVGAENPRGHIVLVRRMGWLGGSAGIGTILVGRQPFSDQDLNTLEEVADRLQFEIVLSPRYALDTNFAAIAAGEDLDAVASDLPVDITAPTDDNPFFFQMLRLGDAFDRSRWLQAEVDVNLRAVVILGLLLLIVLGLVLLCIIVPLVLTTGKGTLRGAGPLILFFLAIGLGFMMVEISQMQRLTVFLGHPTYGLSVLLFSLLLSSGLGSLLTDRVGGATIRRSALVRLALLLAGLALFGFTTPWIIGLFAGATTPVRIAVAVAILFPLGLGMGMAFPLGIKVAASRTLSITPWLWGINGAASVCASVLATTISLGTTISTTFWSGFCCYVLAFGAFLWASRRPAPTSAVA